MGGQGAEESTRPEGALEEEAAAATQTVEQQQGQEAGKRGQGAAREAIAGESSSGRSRGRAASEGRRRFQRELRSMMYGFGDDRQPQAQTVQLMEDMVVDYVQKLLQQATAASEARQRGARRAGEVRVRDRDLLFALRKDPRRYERVQELLEVWKEVKAARGSLDAFEREE